MTVWDVVVVGAGAAGLMAAIRASQRGRQVLLLEKNDRAGLKILMSGGTRCNLTQATDSRGIVRAFGGPGRFLHSALAALSPQDLLGFFASQGVPTKIETTGKVFPVSDKAADVLAALMRQLAHSDATLALGEGLVHLEKRDDQFHLTSRRRELLARKVIVTTGGQSYPGCGTTGDGYDWAARFGHQIVTPRPALTPVTTDAAWVKSLRGVTVPDVAVQVRVAQSPTPGRARPLAQTRGSLLFTHFGLSGPAVLDASRVVSAAQRPGTLRLECDWLPPISTEQLSDWLQTSCRVDGKRLLASLIAQWLPRRLTQCLCDLCQLDSRPAAETSRADRQRLVRAIKQTEIPVAGVLGFKKAEVTAGGVDLREVDSRCMQSRRTTGLYFAGEILDLDGPIGGYNFQAAFSTGWLAGASV